MKHLIRESLFAGILIGLGAFGYLALGGIPGAVIFTFGLVGGYRPFTKCDKCDGKGYLDKVIVWK